ncbi:hypothetical protein IFM89_015749 [Coptis chinensis]|uniref:DEAD-box ATP-dependent RNA helicase 1 n=1 Tax=Coptis chinensis TaxID=261450 RepID=A0A835I3P3_9MAGN|nr:hypothetical protein IFM89_015749 [Coptis chinensis]
MEDKKQKSVAVLPWMRSPVDVSLIEECSLKLLPFLDPRLEEALERMGFTSLFPIQVAAWQETIGPAAFDRDLCINSPTGSGKTLAYALPIVQMLSTRSVKCIRALVVLPTRDLAFQVKQVFASIAPAVGLSVGLAVGQTCIADEISELIKRPKLEAGVCYDLEEQGVELQSSVDILVATPGRLMDHINTTKGFTLEHLRYLVVDETDRLLREAYQSWLPTSVRSKTLKEFRDGDIQVLVASDAMTRGMDVEGVRTVINYDVPAYIKTYVHRAGRTARAGQAGRCFTLLRKHEVKRFKKLLQKADHNTCSVYPIAADSIESLRPEYTSALEKLKKCVESETSRRRKISYKSSRAAKRKNISLRCERQPVRSYKENIWEAPLRKDVFLHLKTVTLANFKGIKMNWDLQSSSSCGA